VDREHNNELNKKQLPAPYFISFTSPIMVNYFAIPIFVVGALFMAMGFLKPSPESSNIVVKLMLARITLCVDCFSDDKQNPNSKYLLCIVYGVMMNAFAICLLTGVIPKKED
jgi:hypothetical protein